MTFVSTLGQALDQVERIKMTQVQLATLQTQLTTQKKSQTFEGLGTDVIASKRARANFTALENYNRNIDIADRRLKLMVQAMEEFQNQAEDVLSGIEIQTQEGEIELQALSDLARNTSAFMKDLLNTQDGDRYLFGGSETQAKPITDNGTLDTYIRSHLSDWINDNIDTDELIASYRDRGEMNDTVMGYSAGLSSGNSKNVYVRVDDHSEIDYTTLANSQGMRDLLAGVEMLANLDQVIDEVTLDEDDPIPPGTAVPPGADNNERNENFYRMLNDVASMMNAALDKVDSELYQLSQTQAQLVKIQEAHKVDQSLLENTISDIEDVDLNEVAVKLNSLQIQLEASYRVTATISQLSLANYLGF